MRKLWSRKRGRPESGRWRGPFWVYGIHRLRQEVLMTLRRLVGANMPLVQGLRHAAQDAEGRLQEVLLFISDELAGGGTVASAFRRLTRIFPAYWGEMAAAGEEGGQLRRTIDALLQEDRAMMQLHDMQRQALLYPSWLIPVVAGASIGSLLVLEELAVIVEEAGSVLNPLLRALADFAAHLSSPLAAGLAALFLLGLPLSAAAFRRLPRHSEPVMQALTPRVRRRLQLGRACCMCSTLLTSGMPVHEAFARTGRSGAFGRRLGRAFSTAGDALEAGVPMSQALQAARALPPSLREAAALGEDAGTLPATLWESGEGQLQHAFRRLQFMAALTGPVLIGACGVWVFLMASAMYGGLNDLCTAILEQM